MTLLAILFVLFINLAFTCFLITVLYFLAIQPLREDIKSSLKVVANRPQSQSPFLPASSLEGILPDMGDIPEEALYGDEPEDFKTRPEYLEEAPIRPYNTYQPPRVSPMEQLRSLNPDASKDL